MGQSVNVIERDGLRLHVFRGEQAVFGVASVVVEAERETVLIDAQFDAGNARAPAELIRAIGKPLTTVYISHSDPDYYFGLATVAEAFPEARIVATAQTAWTIGATAADKLAFWKPQLGALAPERIVVPQPLENDWFTVGGRRVEIHRRAGDEGHSWLWIPSARTILGGVYLTDNEHVWLADSPSRADRDRWLAALDDMAALRPELVIPAHFTPAAAAKPSLVGRDPIDFTRRYLTVFESTLAETRTAAETVARMKALYPALGGETTLETSAKVLKGERLWTTVRAFPPLGRKAEVDFGGEYLFELDFTVPGTMTFRGLKPRAEGRPISESVRYTAVQVAPEVYMVYWIERDTTRVVHVEDYGRGVAYTNIAAPDGSFTNLRGTLRLLDN